MVTKYQKRISGPLLDRIDIHIDVPAVRFRELIDRAQDNAAQRFKFYQSLAAQNTNSTEVKS